MALSWIGIGIQPLKTEERPIVYDFLQAQLQQSVPYKLMADLQDVIEKEAQGQALAEEVPEMSFEELLTQEKDTAFW